MNWRSRKLLDCVHLLPCTWPLPHECGARVDGAEPAHSNRLADGKGHRIKAHDYRVAACCHAAHVEYDQGHRYDEAQKAEAFEAAHRRTVGLLFERGLVRVA